MESVSAKSVHALKMTSICISHHYSVKIIFHDHNMPNAHNNLVTNVKLFIICIIDKFGINIG